MKHGIAVAGAVRPKTDEDVKAALESVATRLGRMPEMFAIWRSLTRKAHLGQPSDDLLKHLRERSVRPIIYLETCERKEDWPSLGYEALLAGKYDEVLATFTNEWPIVRFDHEMNGGLFPWTLASPGMYRAAFRHAADIVQAPMLWCPSGWRFETWEDYYPGEACKFVGFDRYARWPRDLHRWTLPRFFRLPMALLHELAPDKPVIVAELGAEVPGNGDRSEWLRGARRLEERYRNYLYGIVYFDIDLSKMKGQADWSMDESMYRVWASQMGSRT